MKNSAKNNPHLIRTGIMGLAIGLAWLSVITLARAQDVVVPMPSDYVASQAASAPEQIPDAAALLQDDGSTIAVPIPGGGAILVDGPASETPTSTGPIEHWATLRNNPFSVGTGPAGPIAPPQ